MTQLFESQRLPLSAESFDLPMASQCFEASVIAGLDSTAKLSSSRNMLFFNQREIPSGGTELIKHSRFTPDDLHDIPEVEMHRHLMSKPPHHIRAAKHTGVLL